MAKDRKPKHELEAMILAELRQTKECEGVTGVVVRGVVEDRINTWEVSNIFGDWTPRCEDTINQIVARLRQRYDLVES